MNEDFTLTTFAEPITDLADEPQLPADEMKRRLQAPADELRQAHNALAQTVKGITDATYPDTVTEAMLTDELAEKINGKAEETSVASRFTAEQTAREAADDALSTRLTTVEDSLPEKCEIYTGTYTGNWSGNSDNPSTRTITLGFQPKAVIVASNTTNGTSYSTPSVHVALPNVPSSWITITATGFTAGNFMNWSANGTYRYIAFK